MKMEHTTNQTVQTRPSAFRVVRPITTPCHARSLLVFQPQFWTSSGERFPFPPVSHYHEAYSSQVNESQVHQYEKKYGGHSFLSPHNVVAPETQNNVIIHTSQAGQNCKQKDVWNSLPASSNPVVCSAKSLCRREDKTPARNNTTCPVCHKVFGRVTTLKVHLRIHRGEKPYMCSYCGKSFSQSGNLTTHIRVHTGKKPYSCKVCGKQFSQSSALKGHMKIHSRETTCHSLEYRFFAYRLGFASH